MAPESTLNKMLSALYVQLHKLNMYYVVKKRNYVRHCRRLSGGGSTPPYTVTLDFREGRPRYYVPSAARRRRRDADDTVSIEEFLTTSAIRVTFRGKPPKGNNHVVAELSVFPRWAGIIGLTRLTPDGKWTRKPLAYWESNNVSSMYSPSLSEMCQVHF